VPSIDNHHGQVKLARVAIVAVGVDRVPRNYPRFMELPRYGDALKPAWWALAFAS
jgi:hypothetical protein